MGVEPVDDAASSGAVRPASHCLYVARTLVLFSQLAARSQNRLNKYGYYYHHPFAAPPGPNLRV